MSTDGKLDNPSGGQSETITQEKNENFSDDTSTLESSKDSIKTVLQSREIDQLEVETNGQGAKPKRLIKLTQPANEQYELEVQKYTSKLMTLRKNIETSIQDYRQEGVSVSDMKTLSENIKHDLQKYQLLSEQFIGYLRRKHTEDSLREESAHTIIYNSTLHKTQAFLNDLFQNIIDTASRSMKTTSTRSSKSSSILMKQKAKMEAAKTRLEFAEKEAALERERIKIEQDELRAQAELLSKKTEAKLKLDILNTQKEAAIAEAEFNAVKDEIDIEDHKSISLPKENTNERVRKYLDEQRRLNTTYNNAEPNTRQNLEIPAEQKVSAQSGLNLDPRLDPRADDFVSQQIQFQPSNVNCYGQNYDQTMSRDFTRFLLKKDLLMSRFNVFNDRPEYYPSWKNGFKVIINEMAANASEEIDLLMKWTGPLSKNHVQSIKASNTSDPTTAFRLIWERLDERFGSAELIESVMKKKLANFPRITNRDFTKLYDLSDILSEIVSLKQSAKYGVLFSYFDSSIGVSPIVNKLPYQLQERWTSTAVNYNQAHDTIYPPFTVFADFIRKQSKIKNNPSFVYETTYNVSAPKEKPAHIKARTTDIRVKKVESTKFNNDSQLNNVVDPSKLCPIHNLRHTLNECRTFKSKPLHERKRFLRQNRICYKCCISRDHIYKNCPNDVKCAECGKTDHPSALHMKSRQINDPDRELPGHGGEYHNNNEKSYQKHDSETVGASCTQICFDRFGGKSCAKIVLVKAFMEDNPTRKLQLYAMLDDQSNRTLGKSEIFDYFGSSGQSDYVLTTCSGTTNSSGRKLSKLIVESFDETTRLELNDILECDSIPSTKDEIPTPGVVMCHKHLNSLTEVIPPYDNQSEILLLIGRDVVQAYHVLDQIRGPNDAPYAQKLPLGWTIIGETCLGKVHRPDIACVKKTYLQTPDRLSIFSPCKSEIKIQETTKTESEIDQIGNNLFIRTKDDNNPGLSRDDREFLDLMERDFRKYANNNWSAPLPFRSNRPTLRNNKIQAERRAKSLDANLRRDPVKREHFQTFMKGIFEKGHAEIAPEINKNEEQWYLPIFGVYHPKKPGKLRAVFDSSAKFDGLSLNDVLLSGPDFTNSLLGVLLRFRRESVAVMADIEQMFYCFKVHERDRNYLRFLWYTDNDFSKHLREYRMTVHVFGNSPSPAIATYGLRKTVKEAETEYGEDVSEFVLNDFYVDDGLNTQPTAKEAIDLVKRTQSALQSYGNLRLHKISSNDEEVMKAFASDDLAKDLKDLDFDSDSLPTQRSLGMNWDLRSDCFTYEIERDTKPFTRRGLLSTINSIYDPLGFLAPVTIQGKLILRSAMTSNIPWDEPLPQNHFVEWEKWRTSLQSLETMKIPRMFLPGSFQSSDRKTIHIYSDASEKAVAAVSYLQLEDDDKFGFIMGKAKVAPSHGHTIPRLELCGAVLATELGQIISDNLNIPLTDIRYYTDSRVILGYIHNSSRRFFTYVANRVAKIYEVSDCSQWTYVHTESNPADLATRSIVPEKLQDSIWLSGPQKRTNSDNHLEPNFPLQDPEHDKEIRNEVVTKKIQTNSNSILQSDIFERFSDWKSLVYSIASFKNLLRKRRSQNEDYKKCTFKEAEMTIIRAVQNEIFESELANIENKTPLNKNSALLQLNPFIDDERILRVGGRIGRAILSQDERHPIIIPSKHWIATLLIRYFHNKIQHQGRHFTSGAIRSNGFWIIGEKRLTSSILHKCVTCRMLRRPTEHQKMADLPEDRVQPGPPFTNVGIDTFGPWSITTRRTRGGVANSKRWAIIFTCMSTRGVHLEVVEEMSTSSFINAFKRFTAVRGDVKLVRSDRGTNFVGATDHLGINAINVEDGPVKQFMYESGIDWKFNSPHSSHMGGSWERMIRTTRSILDAMIAELPGKELSHEVLVTLLAEVSAIINSRPLTCSTDSEHPYPLTPSLLITQKPNILIPSNVSFDCKDMYRSQWKKVQYLADIFWKRWHKEYLHSLQMRRKWTDTQQNVKEGDIVLLKDNQTHRLNWPMGIVTKTFPSNDNLVRKVELKVVRTATNNNIKVCHFVRPISELVILVSES